ncbi:LOW QUALITY PROTEIN: cytosolic endo-beta-N-acetylglucosaminidase 1 [Dioscorea cayenensis subsp. rotundata]|uniref:mannosyl-glycoprotein endo-beta-N-acetylglucosaminidase n=1 Tax=Dioscorea cayennensis subsp. rotundata TaxID=55577 RepID=A0AB40CAV4_DIOCR|nr:LOW QUALITY PROTEIN: cytosolic endo-beta-N-acetylglucosaminidase 1 [Dioscorea cayenensis subsp. rotundata]
MSSQAPTPSDPTKPSIPISYPIKTLAELASRSYFESFHYPFNQASVPLPSYAAGPLSARRRLLVCHDMKGGYVDDQWVQGGSNPDAYAIWHWFLMDVFVYFSHDLVTLPPPCWTNAAHTHGVKVLGTFITEWDGGKGIWDLLASKDSAHMYAERLAELAKALGFDGWLLNIEVNLNLDQISNLKEFVSHLTSVMHSSVPGSLVIWYDAVTMDGRLIWQNRLNEKNKPFFDACDGIFVNYSWEENYPKLSAEVAGERRYDVYMGIDVFGRNTFGGGEWNTNVALDVLKDDDVSAAVFAPGWVYETKQKPDFQTAQNRWWGLIEKSWGVLQTYPKQLPFYSNFDQGHGLHFFIEGAQVGSSPWNNISDQGFQPLLDNFTDQTQTTMQVFINFKDIAYSGGGSITFTGSLNQNASYSTRLFHGQLPCGDQPLYISYSVKSDGKSLLGIAFGFSSNTNTKTSILLANDTQTFPLVQLEKNYGRIMSSQIKSIAEVSDSKWVILESSIQMKGYTLTDIRVVSYIKRVTGTGEQATDQPYDASLGHISIRNTSGNMEFPSADAWIVEGQNISWASPGASGIRTVSLKLIWKLKAGQTSSFVKYNIYVEKQSKDADGDANKDYLGIARVNAFYISDLEVANGVTSLRFIVQVCGLDGSSQELLLSPYFLLVVQGQ